MPKPVKAADREFNRSQRQFKYEQEQKRLKEEKALKNKEMADKDLDRSLRDDSLSDLVTSALKLLKGKSPVTDLARKLRTKDVTVLARMVQKFSLFKDKGAKYQLDVMRYLLLSCALFGKGESKAEAEKATKQLSLNEGVFDQLTRKFGIASPIQERLDQYAAMIAKGRVKAVGKFINKTELLKIFKSVEDRTARNRASAIDVIVAVMQHNANGDLQDMANDMLTELKVDEKDIKSVGEKYYYLGKPYNKSNFEEKIVAKTQTYLTTLTESIKDISTKISTDLQDYPAEARIVKAAFVTTIGHGVKAIVSGDVADMKEWQNVMQQAAASNDNAQEQKAAGVSARKLIKTLQNSGNKRHARKLAAIMGVA